MNDIANELFILNKHTVETLFKLENCTDCIALYVFFYKTAKWQETNSIKANETYIKKCLGWGYDKIRRTKTILKDAGLINMIQARKDNKIDGWFIEVSYLVSQEKSDKIKVINNEEKQEVGNPTGREQEIYALKDKINMLENNINMLKEENNKLLEIIKSNNYSNTTNNYTYINNADVIDKIQQILDFWNEKEIIKHNCKNGIREDIKAAINKALKESSIDEIKMAIERYKEVLDSDYFFSYKWNIVDFLCRKFGYKTFLDDGSNWINYLEWKKNPNPKPTYNNPTYHNPKEVVKKKLTKFEEDYFAEQEKRFYEGK